MARITFPSVESVATALAGVKATFAREEDGVDVRLQVTQGGWGVLSGDAQYDTDHRGYWGASYLDKESNVRDVARELIAEAREDFYCSR